MTYQIWSDKLALVTQYQYKKFKEAFCLATKKSDLHFGEMTLRDVFVNLMDLLSNDLKGLSSYRLANIIINLHNNHKKLK